jgi:tetratricopeptide (TPR) repeat protein
VGVPTAFITIPEHIYLAFQLQMPPDEARKSFQQPGDLIEQGGKAWVPLEITKVQSSFLEAWFAGARQWRENQARTTAKMYPLAECWQEFEPVASVAERIQIEAPEERALKAAFVKEMDRFVSREIQGRVAELEKQIAQSRESWKPRNSLGVLYARYGLLDKALAQFTEAAKKQDYLPALFNLGNLLYKQERPDKALEHFQRASTVSPNNPAVLLQLSRCYYELGRFEESTVLFERVRKLDSKLAGLFPYLDTQKGQAARGAAYDSGKEVVLWQEE